jgi:hypothetical protein
MKRRGIPIRWHVLKVEDEAKVDLQREREEGQNHAEAEFAVEYLVPSNENRGLVSAATPYELWVLSATSNSLHKSLVSIEKRQASAEMALLDMRRIMDSNHEADLHGPRPSAGGHIHSKSELTGPKYSTTTKWLLTPGVMLMYSRSSKATQRRYSLFFGAVLGSSRVLLVNWNIFALCVPSVRVRNIIPSFSPVVQACKTVNAELVDGYLRAGTVSPNVVTQDNYTLLTVSPPQLPGFSCCL